MGPPPLPEGVCSRVLWPWGIGGEQSMPDLNPWRLDRMEEGSEVGGDGGLRFFLQFDPGKVDRALLGVSLSALFSRVLGWARNAQGRGSSSSVAEDGREPVNVAAVVSAAALAAAVSVCLAAVHASGRRPRLQRRRRRAAAAMARPSSAARPRGVLAFDGGLRILSSKDESLGNVIHGASIGAGDDEPVIVARVETTQAVGETERDQPDEERREVKRLRELCLSLVEREQRLELRLQELQSLRREEAAAAGELENRVAAAAMETRLLELRVASLQEENGRLRAQLVEVDDARAELARAKEKLRAIKERVQAEQEEARREAAALRARVEELETGGEERARVLAVEAVALREANARLAEQNMELQLRPREAEQAASSVHQELEEEMVEVEEARRLRETNEMLTRQVEELRSDQYAHVDQLVYLKWVNACLRHELSDHGLHPPCSSAHQQDHDDDDGSSNVAGVCAMELSKSMSFRSSERAKQLMLQYGHPGLDPALFSPLHELIDGDHAPSPAGMSITPAASTATAAAAAAPGKRKSGEPRNKLKFLGNIKKLLAGGGKRNHSNHHGGGGGRDQSSRQAPAPSADEYLEKAMQWLSAHDVLDFDHSYETTPLSSCDRTPPSTATTATTRGGVTTHADDAAQPATLVRSKSDGGRSHGREARRYHSLRPDHLADDEAEVAPEKWERRRRSEELRSPGPARA